MVSYLITTLFLGKSPKVNLPVHALSAHFSPVTGSLLLLKQLIPKRESDLKQNIVPDEGTALCDAYTLPIELACPLGSWDLLSLN